MTLNQLKEKYPWRTGMKYEPSPGCWLCKGTGEEKEDDDSVKACICVYMKGAQQLMMELARNSIPARSSA